MKIDSNSNEQVSESISNNRLAKKRAEANKEIRELGNEHMRHKSVLANRQNFEIDTMQDAYQVRLKNLKSTYEDQMKNIENDYEAAKIQARVRHEEHMSAMKENFTDEVDRFQQAIKDGRTNKVEQLTDFRKSLMDKKDEADNSQTEKNKKEESKA